MTRQDSRGWLKAAAALVGLLSIGFFGMPLMLLSQRDVWRNPRFVFLLIAIITIGVFLIDTALGLVKGKRRAWRGAMAVAGLMTIGLGVCGVTQPNGTSHLFYVAFGLAIMFCLLKGRSALEDAVPPS